MPPHRPSPASSLSAARPLHAPPTLAPQARVGQPELSLFSILLRALTLRRQRRSLRHLDARMLDDIGISADQAQAESERPFWDAPAHWRAR